MRGRAATLRGAASLPEHLLDPERLGVPDDAVTLPHGCLPCAVCGVAVAEEAGGPVILAEPVEREGDPRPVKPPGPPVGLPPAVRMTLCAVCADRRETAARVAACHPGLAVEQVEGALDALAVLRQPVDLTTVPTSVLVGLVRHLSVRGSALGWARRFAPVWHTGARDGTCSPYGFAHVRASAREDLRRAYAAALRERIALGAPPVPLTPPRWKTPPPSGTVRIDGCLLCGVRFVPMPAVRVVTEGGREKAARTVWTPKVTSPAALGVRVGPDQIEGYLCRECNAAVESAGSLGATAMEKAIGKHLDGDAAERWRAGTAQGLLGLVGWGGVAYAGFRRGEPPPAANDTPWQHLDLTRVTAP